MWELCYRVFSSVFSFCKAKGYYYWKHNVCSLCGQNQASGLLQIGTKSKNDNDLRIFRHDVNVKLFWPFFLSIFNFSYWSKFHVNIITSSGLMTIFFYKGLTRNPEMENTPSWVLLNIWRLGQVIDTKFSTNVSNRMLLNSTKFQCYSFYRSWVIKAKSTGRWEGGSKTTPPPSLPRLGLKNLIKIPILNALEKMCHIPHVIFETTSQVKVMLDKSVNNVLGEGMYF